MNANKYHMSIAEFERLIPRQYHYASDAEGEPIVEKLEQRVRDRKEPGYDISKEKTINFDFHEVSRYTFNDILDENGYGIFNENSNTIYIQTITDHEKYRNGSGYYVHNMSQAINSNYTVADVKAGMVKLKEEYLDKHKSIYLKFVLRDEVKTYFPAVDKLLDDVFKASGLQYIDRFTSIYILIRCDWDEEESKYLLSLEKFQVGMKD